MLEVTILKTNHAGVEEARKLLPYVQGSDAFGLELEATTKDRAKVFEESWARVLKSDISRTGFLRQLDSISNCPIPSFKDYLDKAFDYMFRSRTPLYYAERWNNEDDASKPIRMRILGFEQYMLGLEMINHGKEIEGIQKCYDGAKMQVVSAIERDKNIAENLETAEESLREIYPTLRDVDPIRLGIQIGRSHQPERYSKLPFRIIRLDADFKQADKIIKKIDELIYDGASCEEVAPLFLEMLKCVPRRH